MNGDEGPRTAGALSLPHLIKWAELAVRARVEQATRALPVSPSQLFALVLLEERGQATAAEMARLMYLTPQAMTNLLGPLRRDGLIERETDDAHRRRLLLRLSRDGRDVLAKARAKTPEIEAAFLGNVSAADRATLSRLLERIARPVD